MGQEGSWFGSQGSTWRMEFWLVVGLFGPKVLTTTSTFSCVSDRAFEANGLPHGKGFANLRSGWWWSGRWHWHARHPSEDLVCLATLLTLTCRWDCRYPRWRVVRFLSEIFRRASNGLSSRNKHAFAPLGVAIPARIERRGASRPGSHLMAASCAVNRKHESEVVCALIGHMWVRMEGW